MSRRFIGAMLIGALQLHGCTATTACAPDESDCASGSGGGKADGSDEDEAGATHALQCIELGLVDLWPDGSVTLSPTKTRLPDPHTPNVAGFPTPDGSDGLAFTGLLGERDAPPDNFFDSNDVFSLSPGLDRYTLSRAPRHGQSVPDMTNTCQPAVLATHPQRADQNTSATAAQWAAIPVTASPASNPAWMLTFDDEFARSQLNPIGEPPVWNTSYLASTAFTSLADGTLKLQADATRPGLAFGQTRVSSISTQDSFFQLYGWFEIRAKVPRGSALLSAFWLQPLDRQYFDLRFNGGSRNNGWESYEVDIFEQPGLNTSSNSYTTHAGSTSREPAHESTSRFFDFPFDLSQDFHVYALEWNATQLTWYLDGKVVFHSSLVPQTAMWLYLNLYVQPEVSGPVTPGEFDDGPLSFDIDYVRVYQRRQ